MLAQTPDDAQAWVTRAVIQTVRGDYDAARASCASVARITSALTASVCRESIATLTCDAKGAWPTATPATGCSCGEIVDRERRRSSHLGGTYTDKQSLADYPAGFFR